MNFPSGNIDFEGQKTATNIAYAILYSFVVISFGVGFFLQDLLLMLYIFAAGTALTFLVTLPPWPYLNRTPVKWLASFQLPPPKPQQKPTPAPVETKEEGHISEEE